MAGPRIASLVLVATTSLTWPSYGQEVSSEPPPRRPSAMMIDDLRDSLRDEEVRIKERKRRIEAELAALDRATLKESDWAKEFAGEYYVGDGLSMNVSIHIAPKSGISFLNYGCLGLYGGDHGEIVAPHAVERLGVWLLHRNDP